MNQWAASGEKQDEERYGQFWKLSGQGEQRCFELFAACLINTEDSSRTGENCRSQGAKEQKQEQEFCGICGQEMTDGTNAAELKIGRASQIGDVSFIVK